MPVVLFGVPIALEYIGISIITLSALVKTYIDSSDVSLDDDDFVASVKTQEEDSRIVVEKEANEALIEHNSFVSSDAPEVEEIQEISTVNPLTMPDYLSQQNELLQVQIQATKNLIAQSKFNNDLLSRSIQSQIVSNANSKMIAETLSSSLPALVMQMQQVAKIPATMKIKSEMETSHHEEIMEKMQEDREFKAIYSADSINAINELKYSVATTQNATANATYGVVSKLNSVSVAAEYQTTKAVVTRLDGSVYAELTPQELSTHKDISISEAKIKEKELGDYATTEQTLKNLDGNVVAKIRPIEAQAVKNVVDAKNATDEMEFEMPDDIIGSLFGPLTLPTFTNYNYDLEEKFLFEGAKLDV